MRLHAIERRVLAAAGITAVLVVLLTVTGWSWAILRSEDDSLATGVAVLALVLAVVILVSSWPVLHAGFAALTGGGSSPRRPRLWIAVFVTASALWGGVLLWPLIFLSIGLFWVVIVLGALFVARRLVLRGVRRTRG